MLAVVVANVLLPVVVVGSDKSWFLACRSLCKDTIIIGAGPFVGYFPIIGEVSQFPMLSGTMCARCGLVPDKFRLFCMIPAFAGLPE